MYFDAWQEEVKLVQTTFDAIPSHQLPKTERDNGEW
jgi:hypothetical protein